MKYCGFRTSVSPILGRRLLSIHGPVLTAASAFLKSPNFSTHSRGDGAGHGVGDHVEEPGEGLFLA